MEYIEFIKVVEIHSITVTEKTLRLWHAIYKWVLQYGYADTADSPDFVSNINTFRRCSIPTINNHLRRMAEVGLLKRNVLKRKLTPEIKEDISISSIFFAPGIESIPTTFIRYCLPEYECSLELKSAKVIINQINNQIENFCTRGSI